jgi:dihydrofolate synthase / folylpolyglutamate synthase
MQVTPIKTNRVEPNDDIFELIKTHVTQLPEKSVLVITSKVVALCEGVVVKIDKDDPDQKFNIVREQAEYYLEPSQSKYNLMLTIKNSILAVNAGLDASNVDDHYVLLPQQPYQSAAKIWDFCRQEYGVKELGILITDSKSYPLRWGRIGTTISHCGFKALTDKVGHPDLYGKPLNMTKVDVAEGMAMAAVLEMGEADESQPLCLIESVSQIEFQSLPPTQQEIDDLKISLEDDVYAPLLTSVDWKK